jgi:primosomal protein N' (replication factor Y)
MLNFPDYVSYERAFQLITQVTGRAGRGEKPGKVFIQSYKTDDPIFIYIKNHDYKGFYTSEIKHRKDLLYPPFTTLTRIIFQSLDEKECMQFAEDTLKQLTTISNDANPQSSFLGPAPCFFTKLHGKYRYHILCKIKNDDTKYKIFSELLGSINKNSKVEIVIDIDSQNLL